MQNIQGRVLDEAVVAGMGHMGQNLAGMITFDFDVYHKRSGESLEGVRQRDNLMRFVSFFF